MSNSVEDQLKQISEKLDRVLHLLEIRRDNRTSGLAKSTPKPKVISLSPEEIEGYQANFERLFSIWEAGEELQVEKELNEMDADILRRFADANNLNVTSKTSKQKIMQFVAGRFRERRQLMRSHFNRSHNADSA